MPVLIDGLISADKLRHAEDICKQQGAVQQPSALNASQAYLDHPQQSLAGKPTRMYLKAVIICDNQTCAMAFNLLSHMFEQQQACLRCSVPQH